MIKIQELSKAVPGSQMHLFFLWQTDVAFLTIVSWNVVLLIYIYVFWNEKKPSALQIVFFLTKPKYIEISCFGPWWDYKYNESTSNAEEEETVLDQR